ncbi:hypothetical protein Trydic_g18994 [Trypoxylus dichotomus]
MDFQSPSKEIHPGKEALGRPRTVRMPDNVKAFCLVLEPNTAVRQKVCTILRNTCPPNKNPNTNKLIVLVELKRDENIIILTADKGNATMVLDRMDYKDKMQKHLGDPTHKPTTTDPTYHINNAPLSEGAQDEIFKISKNIRAPEGT